MPLLLVHDEDGRLRPLREVRSPEARVIQLSLLWVACTSSRPGVAVACYDRRVFIQAWRLGFVVGDGGSRKSQDSDGVPRTLGVFALTIGRFVLLVCWRHRTTARWVVYPEALGWGAIVRFPCWFGRGLYTPGLSVRIAPLSELTPDA